MEGIIIGGIVALLLVWIISVQRRLTGMEENLKDEMKQVGVLLSSHLEALTALLDRSYAYVGRKSQELLSIVSSRRNVITADSNPTEVQAQERLIGEVLKDFSAMAERFPEMKRDAAIAKSLDAIDSYGKMVRPGCLIYNDSVTKWNRELRLFPNSLVAKLFGFHRREPMEIAEK